METQVAPKVYGELGIDKPIKIMTGKKVDDKVICTLSWEPRETGIQPNDSDVTSDMLKDNFPELLLDFYESRLNFDEK